MAGGDYDQQQQGEVCRPDIEECGADFEDVVDVRCEIAQRDWSAVQNERGERLYGPVSDSFSHVKGLGRRGEGFYERSRNRVCLSKGLSGIAWLWGVEFEECGVAGVAS